MVFIAIIWRTQLTTELKLSRKKTDEGGKARNRLFIL